jgi:hypothetical protein
MVVTRAALCFSSKRERRRVRERERRTWQKALEVVGEEGRAIPAANQGTLPVSALKALALEEEVDMEEEEVLLVIPVASLAISLVNVLA